MFLASSLELRALVLNCKKELQMGAVMLQQQKRKANLGMLQLNLV